MERESMTQEHRNRLARAWLIRNDPEGEWESYPSDWNFVEAVEDNLANFGPDESRASRFFIRSNDTRNAQSRRAYERTARE